MTRDPGRKRLFHAITTWGGISLLVMAIVYFGLVLWPKWEPELNSFWETSRESASVPMIVLSFISLLMGYYFAPAPWRKILDALKIPKLDKGEVRRNWYVTQMGQYVPGKLWMVVGRMTFLRAKGIGPVKAISAFILENIYMMVALTIMAMIALPFLGLANVPLPVVIALWASALLGVVMLFAPRIQRKLANRVSHRFNADIDDLPHISHKHQAIFIGYHLLSWSLRSMALYFWFRGFGVQPEEPFAMIAVCLLAGPVSWFIALVMVFIPGGIGIREGVQGLLLSGFAGGVQVATVIALGQRLLLMLVEGLYALQAIVYGAFRRKYPKTMNHIEQVFHLAGSVIRSKLAMYGLSKAPNPINVTFSVTGRCQSRCRTCFIWKHEAPDEELDLITIEKLFRSIGWTYFFNISGGEPFLRDDLPEIIRLAARFMTPAVIHIPTNAIAVDRVIGMTGKILDVIDSEAPGTVLTIKPSFDAVGELHDSIRGVPGNFEKLLETLDRLKQLQKDHDNLQVGVGTVISRFNEEYLSQIIEYSKGLGVDSYINEIAEEREEFFNIGSGITPEGDSYGRIMSVFKKSVLEKMKGMRLLPRITTALRVVYYDLVVKILEEQRQVIPCSAGLMNVHINSDGSVWPCAVLAYGKQMGKVDENTDFREIWNSSEARRIRKGIRRGECHCPLANQAYSNILLHPPSLLKAIRLAFRGRT